MEAPADTAYCRISSPASAILPNGRIITPLGRTLRIAPHPYGLALSPDGATLVTANSGTRPFSISILTDLYGEAPQVRQIPEGPQTDDNLLSAVFMGLAFTPDSRSVYVAGGQTNRVYRFDLSSGARLDSIECAVKNDSLDYSHGYLGDMLLSADGKRLYVVDQIGFRLVVIDTETRTVLHSLPTGRYPFGLCFSPDQQRLYVANVGMFAYKPFRHLNPAKLKEGSLPYPASAYLSEEMKSGYRNDSADVPGLGDPNVPESFSVWAYDLRPDAAPQLRSKTKTGVRVGEVVEGIPAVGGASPNSLAATERYVFVSNGNNDCISVIDPSKDTVVRNIALSPDPRLGHFRGVIPFGLALSPDRKRLYVAESGINAVAVIDAERLEVLGHLPLGWFPSKLAVSPDGRHLIVANAKGYGSGPNGGSSFQRGPEGSNIGALMKGSVSILEIPSDAELGRHTQQVLANNFRFRQASDPAFAGRASNPLPLYPGQKSSPIKHIVFISKENRTYDEVFGQMANGRGDPALARYGLNATVKNRRGSAIVDSCDVMVNHLALARRFSMSDNFYVDSDHSADGHRWLVNVYPNEWVETSVSAAYGGRRSLRENSAAPGNFSLVGASGAIYPEDYNEHGSLWDHLARNGRSFFNFGFGLELAASYEDSTLKHTGVRYLVNYPVPAPLYEHSSRQYPTYNMAIPDQFRVDQFIREYRERWEGPGKTLPQVLTILLPNDHGAGERPWAGYPFRESYMMDNDLALGRLVEFLSHTPYWKEMAIFVTEDDSQDGVDHVDAHRSVLMVISPWAKRDHVSHVYSSFGSIFKTFWNLLGIPYLNQYDAGASDLADHFSEQPDFSPYDALPVDPRVFDPQKALDPFDEQFDWKAVLESPLLDSPEDLLQESMRRDREEEAKQNRLSNPRPGKED
jgi:YVTN family beta-propeller protein